MKKNIMRLAAFAAIAALALGMGAQTAATGATSKKLVWALEFKGKANVKPSSSVFSYDVGGGGWGNLEHQAYVDTNVKTDGVSQGNLVFKATKYEPNINEDIYYECPIATLGSACEFLSSRIHTKGKLAFQYGRLEARIKNPKGDGTWPAFWMLGNDFPANQWPNSGEIDIMEGKGANPWSIWGTVHGPGYFGGDGITNTISLDKPVHSTYNVYAIEWFPNKINWYVNNKLFHTVTPKSVGANKWVFNKPYFLILNLAMGGRFTGDLDPDLKSASMYVDYIRYYTINGQGKMIGTAAAIKAGKPTN
jgi:beta-glucanase (GH16 family)